MLQPEAATIHQTQRWFARCWSARTQHDTLGVSQPANAALQTGCTATDETVNCMQYNPHTIPAAAEAAAVQTKSIPGNRVHAMTRAT